MDRSVTLFFLSVCSFVSILFIIPFCGHFTSSEQTGARPFPRVENGKAIAVKISAIIRIAAILAAGVRLLPDNHKQLCELCSPSLTSVEVDMERRGYEAGVLMNHLLEGGEVPKEPIQVHPAFVEHRNSSDIFAFDAPDVVKALRFIRDNANRTIKVVNVVDATSISRRSLEIRFNNLIGISLHDEIWRVLFDRAKNLLASSDLSLQRIAEESGFRKASALVNYFRLHLGITPKEFRVANRR